MKLDEYFTPNEEQSLVIQARKLHLQKLASLKERTFATDKFFWLSSGAFTFIRHRRWGKSRLLTHMALESEKAVFLKWNFSSVPVPFIETTAFSFNRNILGLNYEEYDLFIDEWDLIIDELNLDECFNRNWKSVTITGSLYV